MRLRLAAGLVLLWLVWGLALPRLDAASLWYDEAWSFYAQDAPPPATYEPPRGTRARLTTPARAALDDLMTTLAIVRADVHPPLYFALLDLWVFLAGESVFALRYLSLLLGLPGVALMLPLARRVWGVRLGPGVAAALLLGSSLLWTYYAREARMYTLLITLAAASTLAYLRFYQRPTWRRGLLYALLAVLGVYTHYTAALVPVAHAVHLLLTGRWRVVPRWVLAMLGAVALYVPWLPTLAAQFTGNPDGPLTAPEPTNWTTVQTLIGYFVARGGLGYGLLLVLAAVFMLRRRWRGGVLLVVWLLVVPGAIFAANAWIMPLYNPRYTLAALPALALLAAGGVAALGRWPVGRVVAGVLVLVLAADGLSAYNGDWGAKPPYREVIGAAAAERAPTEPILMRVVGYDPFAYHGEQAGLFDANVVNTAWREANVDATRELVRRFTGSDTVWLMMPYNHPETWFTAAVLLGQGRGVTYRAGVQNMLVYRFSDDDTRAPALPLAFGTLAGEPQATFEGDLGGDQLAQPGETVCVRPPLTVTEGISVPLSVQLTLAQGYNVVLAQDQAAPGERLCVALPPGARGDYYLYVALLAGENGPPYPVYDRRGEVWWGNWIVWRRVSVPGTG